MTTPELKAKLRSLKLLKEESHKQVEYWQILAESFGNEIRGLEERIKEIKKK